MTTLERHRFDRIGWLRAAVLGANDGIVSTASLVVGVAASGASRETVLLASVAGLVAGAMSMAAGEYVSVSSQADTEEADIAIEVEELALDPARELAELARIYEARGLEPALAGQVAEALHAKDALSAHLRDELGMVDHQRARPLQAAVASAVSFAAGAALPLATAWFTPIVRVAPTVTVASLAFLILLGGAAARAGGARLVAGAVRVAFWGHWRWPPRIGSAGCSARWSRSVRRRRRRGENERGAPAPSAPLPPSTIHLQSAYGPKPGGAFSSAGEERTLRNARKAPPHTTVREIAIMIQPPVVIVVSP